MEGNAAVFTIKSIVEQINPILHVIHDNDGEWQFLDGSEVSMGDIMLVTFNQLVVIDPTLRILVDLKSGCQATRKVTSEDWTISKIS